MVARRRAWAARRASVRARSRRMATISWRATFAALSSGAAGRDMTDPPRALMDLRASAGARPLADRWAFAAGAGASTLAAD